MNTEQIEALAEQAGGNLKKVILMMKAGVAFRQQDNRVYEIWGHDGDYVGSASTVDVEYAISFMKRQGIEVGKCSNPGPSLFCGPAFTFHWQGWHSEPEYKAALGIGRQFVIKHQFAYVNRPH